MNKTKINDDNSQEQYPISINNQQCIGPCYFSNTKSIHPLTLNEVGNIDYNYCPTGAFPSIDPISKKTEIVYTDKCKIPTANETIVNSRLRDALISPLFHFSSASFIKVYYHLQNLDDLLKWLDVNKHDPYRTKERVFNNGMIVYGDTVNIIDHRLIQYINDVMIHNLSRFYKKLRPYIKIDSDKITLINTDEPDTDLFKTDDAHTISNIRRYIKEKFLGLDNIHQFMSKFIRYYKEEMTSTDITNILITRMIEYCTKRISMTLE
jgi:hypothetical protein